MPAVQVYALSDGWAAWVKAGVSQPLGLTAVRSKLRPTAIVTLPFC